MEAQNTKPKDFVMSHVSGPDHQGYEEAMVFLHGNVRIRGPAGGSSSAASPTTQGKPSRQSRRRGCAAERSSPRWPSSTSPRT
jgi:hypothetical protein